MKTKMFFWKSRFMLLVFLLLSGTVFAYPVQDLSTINLPSQGAVGGGWSDAGPTGEYFDNGKFEDLPSFTRREVRIDFDWGKAQPVGGSTAEPYKSFPHSNFAVRWTGKLIPRFSEPYTFILRADGVAVLSLKDPQTGKRTIIPPIGNGEIRPKSYKDGLFSSEPIPLKAGTPYEIILEYRHTTGNAFCTLSWLSPSTPEEVIDPVIEQGLNLLAFPGSCWADKTKSRRWFDEKEMPDATGQLKLNSGEYVFTEGNRIPDAGMHSISFTGFADITCRFSGVSPKFFVDGRKYEHYGLNARGPGYDATKNRTEALMEIPKNKATTRFLEFKNAFRDPAGTRLGITDFHIMRPVEDGADRSCPPDAVTFPPMKRMASHFTCLRWVEIANKRCSGLWKDRTLPTDAKFNQREGENWEYLVMFANEAGRDLYLCAPMTADDEYLRKLALLLRYGSDGVEPYTQPVAAPKYPPLNPNLRIYFEVGNEIWNWAFPSSQDAVKLSKEAIEDDTEEGRILNYDGQGNYRRYHAIRTIKASNIFREVFGDAAMKSRVRPLLEFKYANAQGTAWQSFDFLDRYYNNGDGEHVKDPHPVRYYLWGAGGAAYYGVANEEGEQTGTLIADSSFERSVIKDGERSERPSAGPWAFTGTAGIYRGLSSAVVSYAPGKEVSQPEKTAVGMRFRTGEKPLWVYKLGRVYTRGNDQGAHLSILRADDLSVVAEGDTGPVTTHMTRVFGYYWAELSCKKPVQLDANTEYLLVSRDKGGTDWTRWIHGEDTVVKPGAGISRIRAVEVVMSGSTSTKNWKVRDGAENHCPGPVTMLHSDRPDLMFDLPQPPDGEQAAYLSGTGEILQRVNFKKAGIYALKLNITGNSDFRFYFDEQNASPDGVTDIRGSADSFRIGGWGRHREFDDTGFKEEWGSAVFTVAEPGQHTLRFIGTDHSLEAKVTVLDNLRVVSADAIMDSGFGSGSALGQPAEAEWAESQAADSRFGISLGLPRVAYEIGWSLGGDFYQKPIQNWCKLRDPRAEKINEQAISLWTRTGGRLPVYGVYTYWPEDDFAHGEDYPIIRSFIKASQQLPPEPDNGIKIPAELTKKNSIRWQWKEAELNSPGKWMSWTVICPDTAIYRIKTETGKGGRFEVEADGVVLGLAAEGGSAAEFRVKMTKGIHGIRIRNRDGEVDLGRITITQETRD